MTSPPEDEHLPARLRAQAIIRDGEQRIGRAWFRSLTRFLDRVRPAAAPPDGPLDPNRISDSAQFWTDEVNVQVVPEISNVLRRTWRRVTSAGDPVTDPYVADYLNDAGNRLKRVPDEVYARIVVEIERGIREGRPIPDVTAEVQRILTASGSELWPNRARTVARTEVMGAVNAGVFRSAQLDAEARGDMAPMKVWLATEDTRTRPSHRAADGQRTLLGSPFEVGGAQLLFPGDPRGPAQEVIQCRCSLLPVVLGETLDWTDRQNPRG
ncbi:phage minor head protein [Streptomyces scopuliridis]|uniref:Phage head morphogenesis protein n=1 Tax=Streptomyces scopuliridis TaxID=452529 RepID=A0ACD4ZNK6_9ACTN|nr:phage minor head protein [Streptomyces scopuliridis]WSC00068.1 phage head morphogenesis protein [Streptomyces scopuliridis]